MQKPWQQGREQQLSALHHLETLVWRGGQQQQQQREQAALFAPWQWQQWQRRQPVAISKVHIATCQLSSIPMIEFCALIASMQPATESTAVEAASMPCTGVCKRQQGLRERAACGQGGSQAGGQPEAGGSLAVSGDVMGGGRGSHCSPRAGGTPGRSGASPNESSP